MSFFLSGRQPPPRNFFPASTAQQENPFTKDSCKIYVPKKRKSFYFSALEKGRSMSNEPNIDLFQVLD